MPELSAMGWFAQKPITKHAAADATMVATNTKLKSKNPCDGPAISPDKIRGFKKIIYATRRKVVREPVNSLCIFVFSSLNLKNFSINPPVNAKYSDSMKKSFKSYVLRHFTTYR